MEWLQQNWRDVAAMAFVVTGSLTAIVMAINTLWPSKWGGKFGSWLQKVHDVLSPFAMGNQPKLTAPKTTLVTPTVLVTNITTTDPALDKTGPMSVAGSEPFGGP